MVTSNYAHLFHGVDPDMYEGVDLSQVPEKVVLTCLVTMNRQTEMFQQANGRSIIGNLMGSKGLLSWIEADTESAEFKARGFDPADYSYLSSSALITLPKKLNQLTPDEVKAGAGMPLNFTDNDNDDLNDAMVAYAEKHQLRAVTLKVEVDGLFTLQILNTNGIPTPTLIVRGWNIVGIYQPPAISVVNMAGSEMAFAQMQATQGRVQGIKRNTELGITGSNRSKFGGGMPAVAAMTRQTVSSGAAPASTSAFVRQPRAVETIAARPESAPSGAAEVDEATLPAAPPLPTA